MLIPVMVNVQCEARKTFSCKAKTMPSYWPSCTSTMPSIQLKKNALTQCTVGKENTQVPTVLYRYLRCRFLHRDAVFEIFVCGKNLPGL